MFRPRGTDQFPSLQYPGEPAFRDPDPGILEDKLYLVRMPLHPGMYGDHPALIRKFHRVRHQGEAPIVSDSDRCGRADHARGRIDRPDQPTMRQGFRLIAI